MSVQGLSTGKLAVVAGVALVVSSLVVYSSNNSVILLGNAPRRLLN